MATIKNYAKPDIRDAGIIYCARICVVYLDFGRFHLNIY